jgi:cell division septation protein DedD
MAKSTTANIDKEAMRWNLSWHPEGHCDSFTKEAILGCAPPTSGVYGLFNFDCQVFIGESTNIQKTLLRHQSETNFQSRHLKPTGFTFEPCAAELRKAKADELIAKFHPILQNEAALSEILSPSSSATLSEMDLGGQELETDVDHQEFPAQEREKRPNVRRRFFSMRTLEAASAATLVASVAVIFYFSIKASTNIHEQANGAIEKRPAADLNRETPTADRPESGLKPRNVSSIDTAGKPNAPMRVAAKSAFATDDAGVPTVVESAKASPITLSAEESNLSKKWSVQISAVPIKSIADTLVQRLIANGYDGYVVQAEVKGQTYYRVRVGRFGKRDEAESMRQSLAHQEGYRDAYLTGD